LYSLRCKVAHGPPSAVASRASSTLTGSGGSCRDADRQAGGGHEGGRVAGAPCRVGRLPVSQATVRRYHEQTKHRPGRPSANPYGLDWSREPALFKRYPALHPEPPPVGLDRLLRLAVGVHPRRGDPHYRTFMSAGALHPVEVYVGTEAGLAHYHPGHEALYRFRSEDPRPALARAAVAPELESAAVVLVLTGILWRTAWKYGARGWRHIFWDGGAMLANLLALAADADPRLLVAFVDADVAELVGVDERQEAPVALFAAGEGDDPSGPAQLGPLGQTAAVSPRERRFPEAEEAQAVSSLADAEEVRAWREAAQRFGSWRGDGGLPMAAEQAILRRGSTRHFAADPVPRDELAAVLDWTCSPVPGDLPPLCSAFVIAHAVSGLEPGAYRFDPPDRFARVRARAERRSTAHLTLDQPLGGEAAATVFFTADLDRILAALGDRGYRAAQLDAGIRAERASLGAYGRGLGATGLTFYDDEVRRFLATDEEPMMCLAVGIDARRPSLSRERSVRAV
jgi:SagB-type dehydrogenase family enzyme